MLEGKRGGRVPTHKTTEAGIEMKLVPVLMMLEILIFLIYSQGPGGSNKSKKTPSERRVPLGECRAQTREGIECCVHQPAASWWVFLIEV